MEVEIVEGNNMDEIISIINEWDPINLLDICPTDEYQPEIKQIASVISTNNKMNYIDLGKIIYDIFVDSFGEEFKKDIDECNDIAIKILKIY